MTQQPSFASVLRGPGGHIQPSPSAGEGPAPAGPDRWTPWLAELERLAVGDPNDVQVELADALANAGFPALAKAVAPPRTLMDAAWRHFRVVGVNGMSVDEVLNMRPDLTTEQAEHFLIRWDDRIADAAGAQAGEMLVDFLAADDELPDAPEEDVLDELIEARQQAQADNQPHDPGRLYWRPLDEVQAACGECGACDLGGAPEEHQQHACRLTGAYQHIGDGKVLCGGCLAKQAGPRPDTCPRCGGTNIRYGGGRAAGCSDCGFFSDDQSVFESGSGEEA